VSIDTEDRLIALLDENRSPLAAAITRQIRRTVPRYESSASRGLEANVDALLRGMPALIRGEPLDDLFRIVGDIAVDRARRGFRAGDFSLACLCFLPVLRHFLSEREPADGMAMYDLVEAVALPFMGRCMAVFVDRPKLPNDGQVTTVLGLLAKRVADAADGRSIMPIAIERV